jgi:recombination protein RecA
MKINAYGNPETTTGGEALAFYATGRISVRGPESKKRRFTDENGEVIGHKAEFEIIKNKLAAPFKKAEIRLVYGEGYDTHWEIFDMANSLGIIDKVGSWYKYKGENIAQGEMNSVRALKENEEIYKEIREKVIDAVGLKDIYERHSQPGPLDA